MDCCAHLKGLNDVFDERRAQEELRSYLRRGLDRHARRIVAALAVRGLAGASILEVGGGIGGLHIELLRGGAASATDVDVAAAYIAVAQSLAERLGLRERVEYRQADFASAAGELPPADIVVLHRVVCCYPDYERLLAAAAEHARGLLVFSYPSHSVLARMVLGAENLSFRMRRLRFRVFAHPPDRMLSVLREHGLRPTVVHRGMAWQVAGAER